MQRKHKLSNAINEPHPRKKMKLNPSKNQSSSISSFVECPICQSSIYKALINIHIDTHYNDNKPKTKHKIKPITIKKPQKPRHQWINCPLCNKSLLSSQINFHFDLECSTLKQNKKPIKNTIKSKSTNNNNKFVSKVTKCPKCNDTVLLTEINMHLDLNCDEKKKKWLHKNKPINKYNINDYKTTVPGLYLYKEFITEEESINILSEINNNKWSKNRDTQLRGTRRSQHYGPPMDEMYRVVSNNKYFTSLPELSKQIGERISTFWNSCANIPLGSLNNKLSIKANNFNELLVNEYQLKDQLVFHFDQRGAFEELLCGLSLCNKSIMAFQHKDNKYDIIKVILPPRSVYFMSGDSRYKYKHGFMMNDILGYRVSLTYRTVRAIFYNAKPPKKKTDNVYTTSKKKQGKLNKKFFIKSDK